MNRLLVPAFAGLTVFAAQELSTEYSTERPLQVACETSVSMETIASEMTRNGEAMEGRGLGGGAESTVEITYVDTVLAVEDGAPTKVKRAFLDAESVASFEMRGEAREMEQDSPLSDETLILTVDKDGDTIAELEDGSDPESSAMLEGHSLTLPLDGLLPEGEVSEGDTWEPEGEAVLAALGLDVRGALFPRPEPSAEEGGRGGSRSMRVRGGTGGGLSYLNDAEWETEAKLTDRMETVDGLECLVIELTFEAEGDMPSMGGSGRDRAPLLLGMPGSGRVLGWVQDNTYEIEITGELLYSLDEQRPVSLNLEGEVTQEMNMEMSRGDTDMTFYRLQEGKFEHSIHITREDS